MRYARVTACTVLGVALFGAVEGRAERLVLRGATLHPVSSESIPQGILVVDGERIVAVGREVAVPADARVVDVQGRHLYPGLVNANTVLGLTEIGSVRGSVDINETGDVNPNVRAEVALNADSDILPVTRAGGVLVAMTAPRGGLIAGTAAVIRLDGWNWEDLTLAAPVGLVVNWPAMRIRRGDGERTSEEDQTKARDEKLVALREAFASARAYAKAQAVRGQKGIPEHDRDPRWEAMGPVLRREIPVLVQASDIQEIRAALAWSEQENVRVVFIAGGDIGRVAPELAARQIPVILTPTYALPQRRWEPYDAPFTIASQLHEAGVRFCFSTGGASNARNLPIEAAAAVAYGLPRDAALRAMTLDAATILGVGDRIGSLESGKEATFLVTDGDPLDVRSHVVRAFIRGREVDLSNRQERLFEKYRSRPRPTATATPAQRRR